MKLFSNVVRLLAIAVFAATAVNGEEVKETITAEDIYDSFIYQDYVVEGIVESIIREKVHPQDLIPGSGGRIKIPMARIKFKISKVLIGNLDKSEITLVGMDSRGQDYEFDLDVGDRYLLALMFWDRGKYHRGGAYSLRRDDARFLIKGNTWFRGRKSAPMSTGRLSDLYRAVEEINNKRSIEVLTREAELVVRGIVVDVWESDDRTELGMSKHIQCIKVKIKSKIKGSLKDDILVFRMIPYVSYQPFWWRRVPAMNVGEDWIVFLKWAEEPGYYPFAGVNGMYRIEDDKLIRDNRVVLKRTPEDFEEAIAREVSRDGDRDDK